MTSAVNTNEINKLPHDKSNFLFKTPRDSVDLVKVKMSPEEVLSASKIDTMKQIVMSKTYSEVFKFKDEDKEYILSKDGQGLDKSGDWYRPMFSNEKARSMTKTIPFKVGLRGGIIKGMSQVSGQLTSRDVLNGGRISK